MDIKETILANANEMKKNICVNHCDECDDKIMPCEINTSCVNFSIDRKDDMTTNYNARRWLSKECGHLGGCHKPDEHDCKGCQYYRGAR